MSTDTPLFDRLAQARDTPDSAVDEPRTHMVPLAALLAVVRDGDELGWAEEFRRLWDVERSAMVKITASIRDWGIRKPICVGADGRVWDGHHRLAAAWRAGIVDVPVVWSGEL